MERKIVNTQALRGDGVRHRNEAKKHIGRFFIEDTQYRTARHKAQDRAAQDRAAPG